MYESSHLVEKWIQVKREELLQAAEQERLAREARLAWQQEHRPFAWRPAQWFLIRLGGYLIAWGERLQNQRLQSQPISSRRLLDGSDPPDTQAFRPE